MDIQKELELLQDSAGRLFFKNTDYRKRLSQRGFITLAEHDAMATAINLYHERLAAAHNAFADLEAMLDAMLKIDVRLPE